jgi:hypothetical protein
VSRPEIHLRKNVKLRRRLLAGGASVHIDFHADRHFDDLGGFPGHFGSPCNRTNFALPNNLMSFEKFASEIFGGNPRPFYAAARNEFTVLCAPVSNQRRINRFRVAATTRMWTVARTNMGNSG